VRIPSARLPGVAPRRRHAAFEPDQEANAERNAKAGN